MVPLLTPNFPGPPFRFFLFPGLAVPSIEGLVRLPFVVGVRGLRSMDYGPDRPKKKEEQRSTDDEKGEKQEAE